MTFKAGIAEDYIIMGMPYFNTYYVMYDFDTSTIAMSGIRTPVKAQSQPVGTGSIILISLVMVAVIIIGGLIAYCLRSKRQRRLKEDLNNYQEI